jgi:hypothetical protein
MDYQNEKSRVLKKTKFPNSKREHVVERLEQVSLKDVPLEDRRKEAKKPLFLARYE